MTRLAEPNYPIRSVDRALELLLLFREESPVGVSRAAKALGVARSTAHRMLAMLAHRGFVEQDPRTKQYVGGPALVDLGLAAVRNLDIRHRVRPHLEALVAEVGETAHLQTVQGRSAVFLDGVESGHALRAAQRTGVSLPAHCTAGGKAVLAEFSVVDLRALYANGDFELEQMTSGSIVTLEALEKDLELTRERKWALNNEESETGLRAVAATIPTPAWRPAMRAAITVAGPLFRMEDDRLEDVAAAITRTVNEIAAIEEQSECDSQVPS